MAAIISISILITFIRDKNYFLIIFSRGLVNPSTPTFDNINLAETITNLIVA